MQKVYSRTTGTKSYRGTHIVDWQSIDRFNNLPVVFLSSSADPELVSHAGRLDQAFNSWPRFGQMLSLGLLVVMTILSGAGVVSTGLGIGSAFLALSVLLFMNYAAWRIGSAGWFVGPHVAMVGSFCAFIIALAVAINAVWA